MWADFSDFLLLFFTWSFFHVLLGIFAKLVLFFIQNFINFVFDISIIFLIKIEISDAFSSYDFRSVCLDHVIKADDLIAHLDFHRYLLQIIECITVILNCLLLLCDLPTTVPCRQGWTLNIWILLRNWTFSIFQLRLLILLYLLWNLISGLLRRWMNIGISIRLLTYIWFLQVLLFLILIIWDVLYLIHLALLGNLLLSLCIYFHLLRLALLFFLGAHILSLFLRLSLVWNPFLTHHYLILFRWRAALSRGCCLLVAVFEAFLLSLRLMMILSLTHLWILRILGLYHRLVSNWLCQLLRDIIDWFWIWLLSKLLNRLLLRCQFIQFMIVFHLISWILRNILPLLLLLVRFPGFGDFLLLNWTCMIFVWFLQIFGLFDFLQGKARLKLVLWMLL